MHSVLNDEATVRRQGMAEAVVRIVLSRRAPMIQGEIWCDLLGLTHQDIRDAMHRLKVNPATPLVKDRPPVPIEPASAARAKSRHHRQDGRHLNHKPRNRMADCEYCGESIMVGKRMQAHAVTSHPEEEVARMTASILADYQDIECPDCGAPVHVKVTIEFEPTCGCRHEPTYHCYRGDCTAPDVPLTGVEAHQREHVRIDAERVMAKAS